MSAAENEATTETTTFDYFGRSWTIPSQVRYTHMRALRMDSTAIGVVDAFLDAEHLAALDELNPTDAEIDKFTDEILAHLGLGNRGNSQPSSASS